VCDEARREGERVDVEIQLFGLEPRVAHQIEVDDLVVALVVTNAGGDGTLELVAGPSLPQRRPGGRRNIAP